MDVNLDTIFRSEEIETEWDAATPELSTFEIPTGSGEVNAGDRRAIFYLLSHFKPRSVLEVGTHVGASTLHVAAALKRYQDKGHVKFISVDVRDVNNPVSKPWIKEGAKLSPAEMTAKIGASDFTKFVANNSLDYMTVSKPGFDFIFLDGDHAAKTVYREIPVALDLLNKDGLVLLHDFYPGAKPQWSDGVVIPGPYLATKRLRSEGAQFQVLPLGRLPWPTKLGSNITSLALLLRDQTSQ